MATTTVHTPAAPHGEAVEKRTIPIFDACPQCGCVDPSVWRNYCRVCGASQR